MAIIPKWAKQYIAADEASLISEQIGQIERTTSGEIVAMVVKQSAPYGYVLPVCWLGVALLWVTVYILAHTLDPFLLRSVYIEWVLSFSLPTLIILAYFAARTDIVRRLVIPSKDRCYHSETRALAEFYQSGLHQTEQRTGLLIFVSLLEHRIVVYADTGISSKINDTNWDELIVLLQKNLRAKKLNQGFTKALVMAKDILQKHFPAPSNNPNELPDHLIIKE